MSGYLRKNERKGGYVWQAVVNLGIDTTGKRLRDYRTFPQGTTRKEAEKVLQKMILEVGNQEYISESNVTVSEFMHEWLDTYCRGKSPSTIQGVYGHHPRLYPPSVWSAKIERPANACYSTVLQ